MDTATDTIDERLTALERDVAVIKANYASKEDLQRELSVQTWRVLTFVCAFFAVFGALLVSATYFITMHLK